MDLKYYSSSVIAKIMKDTTFTSEAVLSGEKDIENRVRTVREQLTCPLFPEGADVHAIFEIERSDEYKKWREEVEKDIKNTLGI